MRKIYLTLCLLLVASLSAIAQNFAVTFQVDMSQVAVVGDTVSVAGNFQAAAGFPSDWTPGSTILTDANSDNVYDITVQLPAGTYEYKFLNGAAWGTDEGVPGSCQVNGNRGITVSGATTIPVVCFGQCAACPTVVDTVDVTFQVDMRYRTIDPTVSVAGDFQGDVPGAGWSDWTPGSTVLSDPNNDSIYTLTVRLPEGTYAYKYLNGSAWGTDESVPSGCAVNNNREVVVVGPGPQVIPVHCFASCAAACIAPLPAINVTFRVNMSNEIVNVNGLFVAGSFQNPAWVKDTLLMTDANSDMVYEITQSIVPSEYQFKYYNGNAGDPDGETADFLSLGCGASNGIGGFNRVLNITGQLTDTILPIWDFNACSATVSTPEAATTSFSVYPNPFSTSTVIELNRWERTAYDVRVISVTGQVVLERKGLRTNRTEISREGMQSGMYFVELRDAQGRATTQKIIVL